jgi:hypothetical protein
MGKNNRPAYHHILIYSKMYALINRKVARIYLQSMRKHYAEKMENYIVISLKLRQKVHGCFIHFYSIFPLPLLSLSFKSGRLSDLLDAKRKWKE